MRIPSNVVVLLLVVLSSCNGEEQPRQGTPQPTRQGPSPAEAPVDEGVEAPTASVACVNGWIDPTDAEQRELPFHVIRRTMRVDGEFEVDEIRYFEGPESPPSTKGYLLRVDRWYVKASLSDDARFRGRWLIEERAFGSGVAAVAPYRSRGFASPDWVGFQYEGEDAVRVRYPGLPGKWAGRPYDFVTGRDLETGDRIFNFPGLPPELAGCLEGT